MLNVDNTVVTAVVNNPTVSNTQPDITQTIVVHHSKGEYILQKSLSVSQIKPKHSQTTESSISLHSRSIALL